MKWLALFKRSVSTTKVLEGDLLISQLKGLQERLALLNESGWCDLSLKLCLLEQNVLDDLLTKTRLMVTPAPWYGFLSIIRSLGVDYMRQSGDGVFALDFAIENPMTKLYSIGIECDAPINPLLDHARSRDIWRQSVLKRAIPNILRISSHGWYENNEQEKSRIKMLVESVFASEVSQ